MALAAALTSSAAWWACGGPRAAPVEKRDVETREAPSAAANATLADAGAVGSSDAGPSDAGADAGASASAAPSTEGPAEQEAPTCPSDMQLVDTTFCTEVERTCVAKARNGANHLDICLQFSEKEGTKCVGAERRQRFCIDQYEYPNKAGAHPPVMVDFHDAQHACETHGKRLCWESEWVAACEGPAKTPFPYGWKRDSQKCNIDNPWRIPSLEKLHSADRKVRDKHLKMLDQSRPSGAMAECKSGFDVHDLTGNFDEWVLSEDHKGKGKYASLKGGAWGFVRNACRPKTTSHGPSFAYYFVSFRCCADAKGTPAAGPDEKPAYWTPPPLPTVKKKTKFSAGWAP